MALVRGKCTLQCHTMHLRNALLFAVFSGAKCHLGCALLFSQFTAVELGLFTLFILADFCSVSEHRLLRANNINRVQLTVPGQLRNTNLTSFKYLVINSVCLGVSLFSQVMSDKIRGNGLKLR